MTVAEMIEWLKTQDQKATVYVVSMKYSERGDRVSVHKFDPERFYNSMNPDLLLGRWEEIK